MSKKARHITELMAETATLERAADDAIAALDDKEAWYVKDFEKHRAEKLLEIRRMIESEEFPKKQYTPKHHHDRCGGKDREISTSIVSELNGRRIFDVREKKISTLASSRQRIFIHDFEDGLTIKDKGNKCSVLFKEDESGDEYMKFITSSGRIIDKLRRAREMEAAGEKIFPCETTVFEVRLNGGRYTYDMD